MKLSRICFILGISFFCSSFFEIGNINVFLIYYRRFLSFAPHQEINNIWSKIRLHEMVTSSGAFAPNHHYSEDTNFNLKQALTWNENAILQFINKWWKGIGLRRLGTINEISFRRDVQGEAMRKEQPDWHLRRWPYDQPRRIPKQLIGLAIINPGVVTGMFWSAAAFSVQWGSFKKEGSVNLVQIM